LGSLVSAPYRSIFLFALSIQAQIGDERAMLAKRRNHRSAELEREVALAGTDLALAEDATLEQIEATVEKLRQILQRVDRQELEPEDWAVLRAVLREAM
jgi:hypothetical protein